jgi:glutamine amidotransferase
MGKICVIDYGVGNIYSAMKALKKYSSDIVLTEDPEEIRGSSGIVLPGQGAFASGMRGLHVRGLIEPVREAAKRNIPILGICLGAQILLEKGYEFGEWDGLGILPGSVVRFPVKRDTKLPHMGWNGIMPPQKDAWKHTALEGLPPGAEMYFVHSYVLEPKLATDILATTEYDGVTFTSVVGRKSIIGCQFHPEKSDIWGLKIIENFVQLTEY